MDGSTELPICDNEPIHIPGSIQPHGLLLVASRERLLIWQAAGDVEAALALPDWQGANLASILNPVLYERLRLLAAEPGDPRAPVAYLGQMRDARGRLQDVSAHLAGTAATGVLDAVAVEFEPASDLPRSAADLMDELDRAAARLQRSASLRELCDTAAAALRGLIGYCRVLIYRFNEDESGQVLGEDRGDELPSFLNHHFPASDIPRQARALYLRNLVRVIPDIHYTPAPLRPSAPGAPIDMTDSSLRSVSPIHLQYMFNMGVRASASFSIVKDGVLWGLVACHDVEPRRIAYDVRVACRSLAAALGREVKAKEEAESLRQRLRLRSVEDDLLRLLSREGSLEESIGRHTQEVQRAMAADGIALLRGGELITSGTCPPREDIRSFARHVIDSQSEVFASDWLSDAYPAAAEYARAASGAAAIVISATEPWVIVWFRAEQIEVVNWAGNPHKDPLDPADHLNPRASFENWSETVRGHARSWTLPELEAASRLRAALIAAQQTRRLQELNQQLTQILKDKDTLLAQKEFLMGEVNHRVQNSLQLVSSFLAMQARAADDPALQSALDEAGHRLAAVGLVHRRLYRGDQIQTIDAARYLEELCEETLSSIGTEWTPHLSLELAPVMIGTDRAVILGLVLTELIINVNKYAYGGKPGPISVRLAEQRRNFQLTVADCGVGRQGSRQGFGSRMMEALVRQLGGTLEYEDNLPGVRAVLLAGAEAS